MYVEPMVTPGADGLLQVVWHNTKEVGCGIKFCPTLDYPRTGGSSKDVYFLVCNYGPA